MQTPRWTLGLGAVLAAGCTPGGIEGTVPTWHSDIQPLTAKHCLRCHIEGGTAPIAFTDREIVTAMAEYMLERIDAGEMPPPVFRSCASLLASPGP